LARAERRQAERRFDSFTFGKRRAAFESIYVAVLPLKQPRQDALTHPKPIPESYMRKLHALLNAIAEMALLSITEGSEHPSDEAERTTHREVTPALWQ
jgi:hypothetical protein